MTEQHAVNGADPGRSLAPAARLLAGAPVVALLGLLCLVLLSFTGWGFETDPAAQVRRDLPWLALAGLAGAGAGAVLTWVLIGRRGPAIGVGAVLGALPAALRVTSYFTGAY